MKQPILRVLSLTICLSAHADRRSEVESFLRDFYDKPHRVRAPAPPSFAQAWNPLAGIHILEEISDPQEVPHFLGGMDLSQISSLEKMRALELESSQLSFSPWSDSYWPLYQGSLAARYADFDYMSEGRGEFRRYEEYVSRPGNSLWEIADTSSSEDPRFLSLSPAEKYDLLVGDRNSSLTNQMWQSARVYSPNGETPATWMGLCHGWAPASYREDRPLHPIEVTARDGIRKITFFPSDIKGLATLLWSNAQVPTRSLGNRCNLDKPQRRRGRLIDPECFDTNPAEWHLALLSQVGLKKKSMIIDATYDQEVWNQPISSYRYDYFNPITRESTPNLEDAKVLLRDFKRDPFKIYRSSRARYLVGIALDLEYVVETLANHDDDNPDNDRRTTQRYLYDLELDAEHRIIGGEWYMDEHPDFVWSPSEQHTAQAHGENKIRVSWDGQGPIPEEFARFAIGATGASRRGQPLAKIVRKLIEMSRTEN